MTFTKFNKQKAHTIYRLRNDEKVTGVSTIAKTGENPEPLIAWANRCGLDGLDYKSVRDSAANIGTLVHFMVQTFLRGEEPDLSEFSPSDCDKAQTCFIKFLDFWEKEGLEVVAIEVPLVSERHQFGGTLDLVGATKDKETIAVIDFKTSNDIYMSHKTQVCGYRVLWNENHPGAEANKCLIVRIGKKENDDLEVKPVSVPTWEPVFMAQLELYQRIKKASQ